MLWLERFEQGRVPCRHKDTPALAGRGVDGQGAPAMLRLATARQLLRETGALQNVTRFCSAEQFGGTAGKSQGQTPQWRLVVPLLQRWRLSRTATPLLAGKPPIAVWQVDQR